MKLNNYWLIFGILIC